jgi:hypothetical protein
VKRAFKVPKIQELSERVKQGKAAGARSRKTTDLYEYIGTSSSELGTQFVVEELKLWYALTVAEVTVLAGLIGVPAYLVYEALTK